MPQLASSSLSPSGSKRIGAPLSAPNSFGALEQVELQKSLTFRLALGIFLLFLLAAPSQISNFWPIDFNLWPQALMLSGLAIIVFLLSLSRFKGPKLEPVGILLSLFLGWNLLSTFTASYKHDAWLEMARLTGALMVYFIGRVFARQGVLLAGAASGGMLILASQALANFASTHDPRQISVFFNSNLFATALAVAIPLALIIPLWAYQQRLVLASFKSSLANALPSKLRPELLASLLLLLFQAFLFLFPVLILAGLAVTSSKGGFVAALVSLVVFFVALLRARPQALKRTLKRSWPVLLVLGLIFGALGAKTIGPRLLQARGSDDNSTQFRAYTWKGTIDMAKASPFLGWGPMSFRAVYPQFAQAGPVATAHESWLQIAAESGFPSLLLLLGAIGVAVAKGWKRLKAPDSSWLLAVGGLASITALFVHGCFDAGWSTTSVIILFAVALSLLTGDEKELTPAEGNLNFAWLGTMAILVLGAMGTQKVAGAEDLHYIASQEMKRGNRPQALAAMKDAIVADPSSARAQLYLGDTTAANGGDPEPFYQQAIALQPRRPGNWRRLAGYYAAAGHTPAEVESAFAKAVELDPLNTELRLERAKYLLDSKNSAGYDDLEKVLSLWDAPYGRYPALAEWVNLDFARATIQLAPLLLKEGKKARLAGLVTHALSDVANARSHEAQNKAMMDAVGDTGLDANKDIDTVESQLKSLQAQLK